MTTGHSARARLHWEHADGLPSRVTTADGTALLLTEPHPSRPRWRLRLPDHRTVLVERDAADHPVLGRCDRFLSEDGDELALASATDWRAPTRIPAVDRPSALPRGAGTAIVNLLASQALRNGGRPLRYHGPYPSPALWSTLMASFEVREDSAQARSTFIAQAPQRALHGIHGEIPIDFHPTPHTWHWPRPRVCVQRRDTIERVYVDGRAFDHQGRGLWRLDEDRSMLVARVVLGTEAWAEVLRLDSDGTPQSEPSPLPPAPADLTGIALPSEVVAVLGDVLVGQAPHLLQEPLRQLLSATTLQWDDTCEELTRHRGDVLELHAGLVAALPTEPTALLGVLVQLVEGPLRRAAAASLAAAWASRTAAVTE